MRNLFLLATVFFALLAGEVAAEPVEDIHIEGIRRTKPFVVERELEFNLGDPLRHEDLEESMRRLRNLGIFSTASYEAYGTGVTVSVAERWTTIPIFKFNQGGGLTQLIVGAFDVNTLGRYLEFGAQFERLGRANSGVLWFRDPRFLNQRLWFGADLWRINRTQLLYDEAGEVEGGFLLSRSMASFALEKEHTTRFTSGMHMRFLDDAFSMNYLPADVLAAQPEEALPPAGRSLVLGASVAFGRLDFDSFLVDGLLWSNTLDVAPQAGPFDIGFLTGTGELTYFRTLAWRSTFGARLLYGATNTRAEQHLFYVGGLDRIRGFADGRFRGRRHVTGNAEYRIPSFDRPALVIQHVAFVDATRTGDHLLDNAQSAAGAGLGLRILSPRIYRLTLRFDYAFSVVNRADAAFSFGAQQFF
jgi:outer membrane protein assembly factor BamA